MKSLITPAALAALVATGCTGAVTEPQPGDVIVADGSEVGDSKEGRWTLGTCSAIGASINAGVGATDEVRGSWTYQTCSLFAQFTEQVALFFNISEPGATSAEIYENQVGPARLINQITRRIDDRIIMVASGGNDLLSLLDPVLDEASGIPLFVGPDGTIYAPVVDAETKDVSFLNTTTGELVTAFLDPNTQVAVPAVPGVTVLVNGAPCFTGQQEIFVNQCLPLLTALFDDYRTNLTKTLDAVANHKAADGAVILFRLEYNAFAEANCLTGAYSIGVDNTNPANAFIPGAQIAALTAKSLPTVDGAGQSFVDFVMEGNPLFGIEGLNGVAKSVAANYDNVTTFETLPTFAAAAAAGGDLVTQDCIHPNDDGHAVIADLAFGAYLEAIGALDDDESDDESDDD